MRRYLFSLNNTFAITIPILFLLFLINIEQQTFAVESVQNATIDSDATDPSFFKFFEKIKNATETPIVSDNATESSTDYNFIAAGDWYCNEETKKTINNILAQHPELIITTGDQVKESPSASCWIKMSKPMKDKMRIAIGNHDTEFANIYRQIVDYHNVKNPYYSHDFENIHFISMSTEHPFEQGSKQYEFIKNDLEKTSKNSSIDWIIVHQHKPLYSTKEDKQEAEQLRDIYQQLFQQYDVDLVISSHNQYYERTYPILYNEEYEKNTNKKTEPKPIITNNSQSDYSNKDNGIIFLTVGTAGDKLDPVKEKHRYYVTQESKFGFLNIKIENDGKTLVGQFHANDDNIIDQFTLNDT
ncbi:MAG TPA: metallophosphoesterase [Nitrososphaeraceae archaeon]|nr:metallophosphoesterase [Nitrososphaeraceae archaeon]